MVLPDFARDEVKADGFHRFHGEFYDGTAGLDGLENSVLRVSMMKMNL